MSEPGNSKQHKIAREADRIFIIFLIFAALYTCTGDSDDDDTICEYSYSRSC